MKIDDTLKMANVALEIILKHDKQNTNCSFKQVLTEIIEKWSNLG